MRVHNNVLVALLCVLAVSAFGQGYYPLSVGNRWDYGYLDAPQHVGYVYSHSAKILRDTVMSNSKRYAVYQDLGHTSYFRQEGAIVYRWVDTGETVLLNFDVQGVDTVSISIYGSDTVMTTVGAGGRILFGRQLKTWTFSTSSLNNPYFESGWWQYTDSIGYSESFQSPGLQEYLIGAVIDGKTFGTITSVGTFGDGKTTPTRTELYQNYPNPFNPTTTIRYTVPHRSHVQLAVFNTLGQEVARLVDADLDPGVHDVVFDARHLASGAYFSRISAGDFTQTRMLLLLR